MVKQETKVPHKKASLSFLKPELLNIKADHKNNIKLPKINAISVSISPRNENWENSEGSKYNICIKKHL